MILDNSTLIIQISFLIWEDSAVPSRVAALGEKMFAGLWNTTVGDNK